MNLRQIISAGLIATCLCTGAAYAQTTSPTNVEIVVLNSTIAQLPKIIALVETLKAEGYTYIEIRRTLLGREKGLATGPMGVREIVMSTATNELMRDSTQSYNNTGAGSQLGSHPPFRQLQFRGLHRCQHRHQPLHRTHNPHPPLSAGIATLPAHISPSHLPTKAFANQERA
ncbi:MAG: hypothetical protein GQ535_15025 [Rhodobacteraceae bacterium]|nr:hypothetical protein [Paracoccaceae bacterium]